MLTADSIVVTIHLDDRSKIFASTLWEAFGKAGAISFVPSRQRGSGESDSPKV
jgi:hypothetical protein